MDLQDAKDRFDRAIGYCDDIVQVHRAHGGGSRGHRTVETSLNRAVVVLAVAAWQTAIQDLTVAALDHAQPAGGMGTGALLRGQVAKHVTGFSTPNAENSRALMKLVDFDPYPYWTWRQAGGRGMGWITITPSEASDMINNWLRLRHDIAHGHATLTIVPVLDQVREKARLWLATRPQASLRNALDHLKSTSGYAPALRLKDATTCIALFSRLATLTARALIARGVGPNVW